MNLTRISVNRPLTMIMVFCVVIVFGFMGFIKMPVELTPDMEIPVLSISTVWSGAGPEDINEQVTEAIEDAVSGLNGVDTVVSTSTEGISMVMLQFEFGTDMVEAITDARNKVEAIQSKLPSDAKKPIVSEIDINAQPVGKLVIISASDPVAIMRYAEDIVQPALEKVSGVNSVDINGGLTAEVSITANPTMLEQYGVTLSNISSILQSSNTTMPFGTITEGENEITLRSKEELTSLDQIKQLQIPTTANRTVQLDKICNVTYGYAEKDAIYRYNGKDSLLLDINKKQSANTVEVMKKAKEVMEELNMVNSEYQLKLINDGSERISASMNNVWSTLIMSSIFSFIIILLFLKNMKASIIVAVAIPLSIIGAVAGLYFSGQSLNMITVGGLVLGVGMVVDNSIVAIENIFKKRKEEGLSIHDAAIEGTTSVSNALIASTLTTVAVFVPIFFTEGIASIMFGALAQSIIFALVGSIFVAITMVPGLFAKFSTGKKHKEVIEKPTPMFDKVRDLYENLLKFCLYHKSYVLIGSIAMLIASLLTLASIGMDLMPSSDEEAISISMELPKGLNLEASDYYITMAEEKLVKVPEIEELTSSLNSGSGSFMSNNNSNTASITAYLVDEGKRKRPIEEVADDLKTLMVTIPDCKISVSVNTSNMGGTSSGFSVKLQGSDLDVLKVLSKQFEEKMKGIEGFENVESDLSDVSQEAQIKIDSERAAQWGIGTQTVTAMLRTAIEGSTVTTAKIDNDTIDVTLKLEDKKIQRLNDVLNLKVKSASGQNIPIGAFSDIVMADSPKSLSKTDGDYSVTLSADIKNMDMGKAQSAFAAATSDIKMPKGYQTASGSNMKMMMESFQSLALALCVSIILVYMVMVAQFESFKKPFIIMFSVPFAFVGVALSLLVTRTSLSINSFIGIILLVGIAVNNGIVLIDHIEQLRKNSSMSLRDAVAHGSAARLRPVLMTTLTTVLGLLPTALGIGKGSENMQPMGIVIFGGLSVSTLVTLLLIPVIYTLFEQRKERKEDRIEIMISGNKNL